jgi:hypothetical protein
MPVGPPAKQLRWGRLILAFVVLAGICAGVVVLVTR